MTDDGPYVMIPLRVHVMLVVEAMDLGRWPLRPIRRALLVWAVTRYHEHMAMVGAAHEMGESPSGSVN